MPNEINITRDFKDEILREQVRLTFSQLPTMQVTALIVALVLCYVVRHLVPHANIVTWILLLLAVVAGRIVMYYRFLGVRDQPFEGAYWKNAYLLLALLSGMTWGLSAFMIFPAGDYGLISLFVLVVASLSASTTISHSSLKYGAALWAVPAMLLYAVRCFLDGGEFEYTVGVLIVLYLFTILNHSFKHHKVIVSTISLKFENLALLEEVQKGNDILRRTSAIDGLTGLANRQSFDECMDREWRRAMREHRPISLIMLDIDHFKLFNDNYGHQGGDDCLKKVAAVIAGSAKRPADLAARYGGEEFMVVLPDTDVRGATEIAEKLRIEVEILGVPHAFSATASVVTVSIGVASLVPGQNMDSSELIKLVDTRLYAAKHDGRNRVKVA
jgi:diguanylate cyclase (GGDEF)-like protein